MLGMDLSYDRWEGLGDTAEPCVAKKERWLRRVEFALLLRVQGSPVEPSHDYFAHTLIPELALQSKKL